MTRIGVFGEGGTEMDFNATTPEAFSERSCLPFNNRWILVVGYRGNDVRGRAINRQTGAAHEFRFIARRFPGATLGEHAIPERVVETSMIRDSVVRNSTPEGITPGWPSRPARWKLKRMMLELRNSP